MIHTRQEVIRRAVQEYELMERLLASLSDDDWNLPLGRPEGKDPWTVKDAVVHILYWKAGVVRTMQGKRLPPEEKGLQVNDRNHVVYLRWHDRAPQEVVAWHRQVQEDVLAALNEAPDEYFSGKERGEPWPADLDQHAAYHRVRDIERVLGKRT